MRDRRGSVREVEDVRMDLRLAASGLPGLLGAVECGGWSQGASCGGRFLPVFSLAHNASVVRPNRAEPLEGAGRASPKNRWDSGAQTGALGISWEVL